MLNWTEVYYKFRTAKKEVEFKNERLKYAGKWKKKLTSQVNNFHNWDDEKIWGGLIFLVSNITKSRMIRI